MAGHGSPPAEDRGNHPNRKVGRDSGWETSPSTLIAAPAGSPYQGPVRPSATYLDPNTLNDPNGLPGLTAGGRAVADRLDVAHTEHFRKYGRGV